MDRGFWGNRRSFYRTGKIASTTSNNVKTASHRRVNRFSLFGEKGDIWGGGLINLRTFGSLLPQEGGKASSMEKRSSTLFIGEREKKKRAQLLSLVDARGLIRRGR